MPALLIADITVTDAEGYEEYRSSVRTMVEAYDGKFITRGGSTFSLEGSWQPHRMVVIEFPSMPKLLAFYDSAAYAPLKALRMSASDSNIIAVDEDVRD
jgi:uncharacterized protein (DUF1330 family)